MGRKTVVGLVLALVAALLIGGAATASSDPLVGTWHQRDAGTSNIFYFIDAPVGGVYPVLYYDDYTGPNTCGDRGPMMWAGFLTETTENRFEGSFGEVWCPDNGDGPHVGHIGVYFSVAIDYDVATDTISGNVGGGIECVGTRQPSINTVEKAIHELEKGVYPPSPGLYGDC